MFLKSLVLPVLINLILTTSLWADSFCIPMLQMGQLFTERLSDLIKATETQLRSEEQDYKPKQASSRICAPNLYTTSLSRGKIWFLPSGGSWSSRKGRQVSRQ